MNSFAAVAGASAAGSPLAPEGAGRWRPALHVALQGRPVPLVVADGGLVAAASLWAGARLWTAWLRERGFGRGERLVCALPPGAPFVMVLVAALWEDLTVVPVPPGADVDAALLAADARVAVVPAGAGAGRVVPGPAGTPPEGPGDALRGAAGPPTPDVRLLLQTSGTTGARRWIALSDDNLAAVLASHRGPLALDGATLLSVLPWHHAFGLVLELLPALLGGAELVRDPSGGRDAASMLRVAAEHPVTHLHAVPHTLRLLAASEAGRAFLRGLRGGLVGGAPADAALAEVLGTTRLRVGYGQTEAAPGIALGAPGEWSAGLLGRPVGCAVRVDADGVLAFQGPSACAAEWRDGAPVPLPADRWVRTGDLARQDADGTLHFEGRLADTFKLANGRFVAAAVLEGAVRAGCPGVREVLVSSANGESLTVALTADGPLPDVATVREALGALGSRALDLVAVDADRWVRTPKGELDRRWPTGR